MPNEDLDNYAQRCASEKTGKIVSRNHLDKKRERKCPDKEQNWMKTLSFYF